MQVLARSTCAGQRAVPDSISILAGAQITNASGPPVEVRPDVRYKLQRGGLSARAGAGNVIAMLELELMQKK
jgi:hypothetical protein